MTRRTWFVTTFLGATALALGQELWASFDSSPDTIPWTDMIVQHVPGEVTFAAIGALALWLPYHFGIRYWRKAHGLPVDGYPSAAPLYRQTSRRYLAPAAIDSTTLEEVTPMTLVPGPNAPAEPLASRGTVVSIVSTGLALAVAFGAPLDAGQREAVLAFAVAVAPLALAAWARLHVYSPATVREMFKDTVPRSPR